MAQHTRAERIRKFGFDKVRAEQLNWMLYISKGYAANLEKTLRTNSFCLHTADIKAIVRVLNHERKNIELLETIIHHRKKGA